PRASACAWAGRSRLGATAIFAKNPPPLTLYNASMTAKTTEKQAVSIMLIGRWEQTGAKLASLAQAFPEEKYETAPVAGVRTFGDVLRHVAIWNQSVADAAGGI